MTIQSYQLGAYLIVVGGSGKANIHFGYATGPLLHTADSLGKAMAWVEDARRDDARDTAEGVV